MYFKDGLKQFSISAVVFLVSGLFAFAGSQTPTQTSPRTVLDGQVPKATRNLKPLSRMEGSQVLKLSINLPLRNREALKSFLEDLYNPASRNFRHYLSTDDFDARFGPTEEDYQRVVLWAKSSGFTIVAEHDDRKLLEVTGPVANIERAFNVTMHTYAHPTEPRTFFAPDNEPSVDPSVPILSIGGLNNFTRPHPKNLHRAPLKNSAKLKGKTIGSGPNGLLAGTDYRAAYAPGVTSTGTGQSVGLMEFDGFYATDITSYESQTGVPNVTVKKVLLDGFNGSAGDGNGEVALDIEVAISMAPGLSSVVSFEENPNIGDTYTVLNSMTSATYTNVKQFSCSWDFGTVNQTTIDDDFMKMASRGQSFFDACGDFGAYTNGLAIPQPDDDAWITIVGGTVVGTAGPNGAWQSEIVWNTQEGPGWYAGAGGVSPSIPIPSWQKGVNMTPNNGSRSFRNIPDVAMAADNEFIVADDGQNENTGGTSAASPLWAAFTALANQQAVAAGLPTLGFLNPLIYNIGTNSGFTACFDDITVGFNTNDDSTEWLAVPGYDLCTGWGSPTGESLIIALVHSDGFQITPGRGPVASGPAGGPFTIPSQTFSLTNTGSSALSWAVTGLPTWLNASSTSGTLSSSGADSVSLTVNSAVANFLSAGVYTADVLFTNSTSGLSQTRQYTLQIGQNLVLDGGFEAGDLCYWLLSGDSSIYTNNFVDFSDDTDGLDYPSYSGEYFAALGELYGLAYLSQTIPTKTGQFYELSFEVANIDYDPPDQFVVQWNSNPPATNTIFNQSNMQEFDYTNMQFLVEATSDSTTLSFGNDNQGFFVLDNVTLTPVAVPIPNIQAPTVSAGAIGLTWSSSAGVSYQVQYATDLSAGNWVNVGSAITASGNSTSASETIGGSVGFYRVIISQ